MPFPFVPVIMAVGSIVSSLIGARRQKKENREVMQFQKDANEQYLQQQMEYNSPASQMQRFQDAGLNPNLIYGQGNPGNQTAPLQSPDLKPTDFQGVFGNLAQVLNQTALTQSQVQANDARIRKTGVDIQLVKLQQAVLAKNPLLDEVGFKAIIDSLKATAEGKAAESSMLGQTADFFKQQGLGKYGQGGGNMMDFKLFKELEILDQRFRLGELDSKVKAEVINSKAFQNAILEVQKKFMTDGDITPQHVMQFIQLLLMKML